MKIALLAVFVLSATLVAHQGSERAQPAEAAIRCADCDAWNKPLEPFRLFGNSYFVGTDGLSAVLITSGAGHVLIDGGLPQSAALIDASIRKLGFRTTDVRLIVSSHEHFDHVGGIAALQRLTGARVAASPPAARALVQGIPTPDDPQFVSSQALPYPPVANVQTIGDGEVLRVGPIALTARFTPGHTPGATTWTWQSCEGERCLNVVYADSLNPVSDDSFRFTGDGQRASVVDSFRRSIATLEQLPCDVLIAPHPFAIDLAGKLAKQKLTPNVNPFIDAGACRAYATTLRRRLDARIAAEKKAG